MTVVRNSWGLAKQIWFLPGIVSAWSAASHQSLWSSIKTGLGGSSPSLGLLGLWHSLTDSTPDDGLCLHWTSCHRNCISAFALQWHAQDNHLKGAAKEKMPQLFLNHSEFAVQKFYLHLVCCNDWSACIMF